MALMCAVDAFKLNDNLFSRVYLNGLVAKMKYLLNVKPQQIHKQVSSASRCYFSIYLMVDPESKLAPGLFSVGDIRILFTFMRFMQSCMVVTESRSPIALHITYGNVSLR